MSLVHDRMEKIINSENFFDALLEEIRKSTLSPETIAEHLAEYHNNGRIDIVETFRNLENDKTFNFFLIRNIFDLALPQISAPVLPVMECVKHLVQSAGKDFARNDTLYSFIEFCKKDATRPNEALKHALGEFKEGFDFITSAMIAGSSIDLQKYLNKAIDLLNHNDSNIVKYSILSLGELKYNNNTELITVAVSAIIKISQHNSTDSILAISLYTLTKLYSQDRTQKNKLLQFIKANSKNTSDDFILAATKSVYLYDPKEDVEAAILNVCIHVHSKLHGAIHNLDGYFFKLLNKSADSATFNKVFLYIEKILENSHFEIPIKSFDNVLYMLFQDPHAYLPKLLTKWLLSQNTEYGRVCEELLTGRDREIQHIAFDLSQLTGKNAQAQYRLACRACGWLFNYPKIAIQLIISLLEKCNKEQKNKIADIVFYPLLISYPGICGNYLKSLIESSAESIIEFCTPLLEKLEMYEKSLESAMKMKELEPSEKHKNIFNFHHTKYINNIIQVAEKNSILSYAPTIQLGYGTKAIYYQKTNEGVVRVEGNMQKFSVPFNRPLLSTLDPHNLSVNISILRGVITVNETNN